MRLRVITLRILLVSLAIAAVAGVLAVLLPADETMIRVLLTAIVVATAAGLATPATMLIERRRTLPAGLYALALIGVEFILTLTLIWLADVLSWSPFESLVATTVASGLLGVAIFVGLIATLARAIRVAAWVSIGVIVVSWICFVVAAWSGSRTDDEWYATAWLVLGFGLVGAGPIAGVRLSLALVWRGLGIAATIAAAAMLIGDVWDAWRIDEEPVTIATGIGMVCCYTSLILMMPLRPSVSWLRYGAIGCAVLTDVWVTLAVVIGGGSEIEILMRLAAGTAIVTGCATLALVVFVALHRKVELDPVEVGARRVHLTCPSCGLEQDLEDGRCSRCRLAIEVRIIEPRCTQCGYLLWGLRAPSCPECGYDVTKVAGVLPDM